MASRVLASQQKLCIPRASLRGHIHTSGGERVTARQLHLGAFMRPVSIHTAAWRYPGAFPDANFNSRTSSVSRRRWNAASSTPSSWPITSQC